MNKKIREATRQEISSCLKDNGIKKIIDKRKSTKTTYIDHELGDCVIFSNYGLDKALKDDLGLELRLYNSSMRRKDNIRKRIESMMATNHCYFLTLTFNDKMLSRNITSETRRRYVRRFLKEQCKEYVANIDFGSKYQREHYHAVVVPKTKIDFSAYRDKFENSNVNCKRLWTNKESKDNYTKYIAKLTNHSLKENGFYQRLIYSRQER